MYRLSFLGSLVQGIVIPTIALALGTGEPLQKNKVVQRVDLVELNHRYDDQGRHCYDQVIFYEWSPDYRRYHVVAWCLVDQGLSRLPQYDHATDRYVVRWLDRESNLFREIWAPVYRETWSDSDPERANKELMDEKYRVSLFRQQARPVVR